jgi:hypothetical protein
MAGAAQTGRERNDLRVAAIANAYAAALGRREVLKLTKSTPQHEEHGGHTKLERWAGHGSSGIGTYSATSVSLDMRPRIAANLRHSVPSDWRSEKIGN